MIDSKNKYDVIRYHCDKAEYFVNLALKSRSKELMKRYLISCQFHEYLILYQLKVQFVSEFKTYKQIYEFAKTVIESTLKWISNDSLSEIKFIDYLLKLNSRYSTEYRLVFEKYLNDFEM